MTDALTPEACRARYADRLRAERAAVVAEDAQTDADRQPVQLDQQSVGRLSRMDAMQGQAMARAMQGRRTQRLRAIDAALARLQGEDFGWCDDCGEWIGARRLDLDPTVGTCIACAR